MENVYTIQEVEETAEGLENYEWVKDLNEKNAIEVLKLIAYLTGGEFKDYYVKINDRQYFEMY